jgi:hypothetical protein
LVAAGGTTSALGGIIVSRWLEHTMQAVRCEACGLKALVAASTCPHCGHLLDIRNSFGELLPLIYCTTCDVSYPARDGACRWCGSKPEKLNLRPYLWKGVGALAFVGMATAAFLTKDRAEPPARRASASLDSAGAPPPAAPVAAPVEAPRAVVLVPSDSAGTQHASEPTPRTDDTAALRIAVTDAGEGIRPFAGAPIEKSPVASPPTLANDNTATGSAPLASDSATVAAALPAPGPTEPPRSVLAESKPKAKATAPPRTTLARKPPPRRAVGWSNAVVRSWATVRAAPSRSARLVGSVGPDTHVQIGEVRGDWRRIRLRGMVGWVEDGRFAPRRVATQRRAAPF